MWNVVALLYTDNIVINFLTGPSVQLVTESTCFVSIRIVNIVVDEIHQRLERFTNNSIVAHTCSVNKKDIV